MAEINFDATNVEPSVPIELLPDGWYPMQLAKEEWRDTKKQDGRYIALEFEMDENHAPNLRGRRAWTVLNLENPSEKAVEIANRDLSAIIHACGRLKITSTTQLCGITILVKLGVKAASGEWPAKNVIKGFKPLSDAGATTAPAASATPSPNAPAWVTGK